jgi:very-short-patch-repair endonuclease
MTKLEEAWVDRLLGSGQALLLDLVEEAYDRVGTDDKYTHIELALAVAMCALLKTRFPEFGYNGNYYGGSEEELRTVALNLRQASVDAPLWGSIFPQAKIGDYRVDFLLLHSKGLEGVGGIVIECDGHEFHEKTKEQAAKDKARDRDLQERGYKVFRFSGSEIWRDPFACAREVLQHALDIAIDSENARNFLQHGDIPSALNALRWIA